jgi:hypothetical protein
MNRLKTLGTSVALTLGLLAFSSSAMAQQNGRQDNQDDPDPTHPPHPPHPNLVVPEIDPGSVGGGLALLGFAATMLVDRRRLKK